MVEARESSRTSSAYAKYAAGVIYAHEAWPTHLAVAIGPRALRMPLKTYCDIEVLSKKRTRFWAPALRDRPQEELKVRTRKAWIGVKSGEAPSDAPPGIEEVTPQACNNSGFSTGQSMVIELNADVAMPIAPLGTSSNAMELRYVELIARARASGGKGPLQTLGEGSSYDGRVACQGSRVPASTRNVCSQERGGCASRGYEKLQSSGGGERRRNQVHS